MGKAQNTKKGKENTTQKPMTGLSLNEAIKESASALTKGSANVEIFKGDDGKYTVHA